MKIQSQNFTQNFTSNIKFVSGKEFDSRRFSNFFYCGNPDGQFIDSFCKGYDIWTHEVRTCSAGGVVDNDSALAFHLFDKSENIDNVKNMFRNIVADVIGKPKSALLIGGKRLPKCENSVPLFEKLKAELKKITPTSIFEVHKNKFAESNIGYESYSDTWFINTTSPNCFKPLTAEDDVLTLSRLLDNFETIKIAPQDRLFTNGSEITSSDCPAIFKND